jgi:hypothetical protein
MRLINSARFAAACLMAGALACAGNSARVDDETAAARDTTTTETPPGYSGMEQDTTMAPDSAPTPVDTFLEQQGTGVPADTQGYGGLEQPDTTGGQDPTGYEQRPSGQEQPGQTGYDTTGYGQQPGQTGSDTSGMGTPMDSVPQ